MKLADYFKSVALQSGVTEIEIKELLDNAEFAKLEIPDAVSTKLATPLLTMESAKNNPDLKRHFTAQVLDGADSEMKTIMSSYGFDDTTVSELSKLGSYKRIGAIAEKIKTLEASKIQGKTVDTEKLNQEIEKLNGEMAKMRDETVKQLSDKDASLETERTGYLLSGIFSEFDYATNVDKEINIQLANSLFNKEVQAKGLKVVRENNTLAFKTNEGTDYFDNNVKVPVKDFASKLLANAKVLKTSDSTQTTTTTATPQFTQTANTGEFKNVADVFK